MNGPNLPARPQPKASAAKHTPTARNERPATEPCKWCGADEKSDEPGWCYRAWTCGSCVAWLADDRAMSVHGEHRQSDRCRINQLQQRVAQLSADLAASRNSLAVANAELKKLRAKPPAEQSTDGWEAAPEIGVKQ